MTDQSADNVLISGDDAMSKLTTPISESINHRHRDSSAVITLHATVAGSRPELLDVVSLSGDAESPNYARGESKLEDVLNSRLIMGPSGSAGESVDKLNVQRDDRTSGRIVHEQNPDLSKGSGLNASTPRNGATACVVAEENNFLAIHKHEGDCRTETILHGSVVAPGGNAFSSRLPPRSIVKLEIIDGGKKRTITKCTLSSDSDGRFEGIIQRMYGRRRSNSMVTAEIFSAVSRKVGALSLTENTAARSCQVPTVLSDILPIEKKMLSDLYIRFYYALLSSGWLQDCVLLLEEMDKVNILDTSKIHYSGFFKACQKQKAVAEALKFIAID